MKLSLQEVVRSSVNPPVAPLGKSELKIAKVLVLGAAESGKSTICRHIRQLHGQQLSNEEILHYKHNIRISCLENFLTIVSNFLKDESQAPSGQQQCVEFLEEFKSRLEVDREFLEKAVTVWRISSLQKYILSHMKPIGIPLGISIGTAPKRLYSDNPANHFLPSFSRIMAKGYCPTLKDILSVRIPTTGAIKYYR